ncbi:hypothetical protein [Nocardia sp. alder85J]|uniref:hypothetical protein n=1 Tax=Nocardia sp. alder85J TaxID=2862949 RepID=UPI001CD1BDFA|nr:hypothetical protein [Nocardia sp. alder85J]MCX4092416.1 hypothetical protein [Nocardia sp. alder85J]
MTIVSARNVGTVTGVGATAATTNRGGRRRTSRRIRTGDPLTSAWQLYATHLESVLISRTGSRRAAPDNRFVGPAAIWHIRRVG